MMRGQRYMAVAVRAPSDAIILKSTELPRRLYQGVMARIPLLRGAVMLWDSLGLGIQALMFSADVAVGDEDVKLGKPIAWSTAVLGMIIGVGVFFVLPVVATSFFHARIGGSLAVNVAEGILRLAMLIGYVWAIGLMPDIRRVYMYHGAEHKAINAFEAGAPLFTSDIMPYSIRHPRCGTNFLLIVALLAIAVLAPLGRPDSWIVLVGSRVALIPVIAGLAYEVIKWGSSHLNQPIVAAIMAPGLALQGLTTRQPDASQVEVAAAALHEVLRLERPELLGEDALSAAV
ncbi:MAG TPA: DUF1385 domain-containing protein [Chloroflexota bacterium]|nr:DUF1385 domain-containing protein [Chloroflexota bacterium]